MIRSLVIHEDGTREVRVIAEKGQLVMDAESGQLSIEGGGDPMSTGTILRMELPRMTDDGIRTMTIVTTGAVGAEDEARALAAQTFGSEPVLSFRSSEYGQLSITYTDRVVTYGEATR